MHHNSNNTLIKDLTKFLEENNLDYLFVNSTNEFLLEYNRLEDCARYHLTGFSGSTGVAIMSRDDIWLFVDGRYHEQAENEVDKYLVNVYKLKMREPLSEAISNIVPEGKTLGIVDKKMPLKLFESLKKNLKNRKIIELDIDPVMNLVNNGKKDEKIDIEAVDIKISGIDTYSKFVEITKTLSNNQAVFTSKLEDIAYFTNLRSYNIPYFSGFCSKLIIEKNKAILFCDYKIPFMGNFIEIKPIFEFDNYIKNLDFEIIFEEDNISLSDYKIIKNPLIVEINPISKMRSIKNDNEINHLKECFKKSDNVYKKIKENIIEGISELELANIVEKEFKDQGARALSFKTILAAGKNSSIIHYSYPSPYNKIKNGDLILLDCGAYFEGGYSTDTTRTFISGEASKKQKEVYTNVLKAFLNSYYSKAKTGEELDFIARKYCIFKDFSFPHGTGHGVGICVHDGIPTISPNSKMNLEKNMVFSIEPGLYKTGEFGVRLENTVFYTGQGFESLCHFEFEEKLIEPSLMNKEEVKMLEEWQNKASK